MHSIDIPPGAAICRPYCDRARVGPPVGVADAECETVDMLVEPPGLCDRAVGRANYAYFRPSEAELGLLCSGGFLELALYGMQVQPFGLAVWQAASPQSEEPDLAAPAPVDLDAAIDAALEALWPGVDEQSVSSRRVYRPVVAIALVAAVPAIAVAIADRLHPHRFDYRRGHVRPPDTFYSGVIAAEVVVRAATAARPAPLEDPAPSASTD